MRCPVCKADNLQGPQCRRCKADLTLLFALEEQRQRTLAEARRCLRRGEWQAAVKHAETANWLRSDEDAQQLAAVAHLVGRDFAGAWRCYQNWRLLRQGDTGRVRSFFSA
jgi:hypothetical protein